MMLTTTLKTKGSAMQSLSRLALAIICSMAAGGLAQAADPNSADARLKAIYTSEWKWRDQQLPDGEDTQKPVQDHLPKMDAASQAQRLVYWQEVLKKLDAIPRAELSVG